MTEDLLVAWNDYQNILQSSFKDLKTEGYLFDATLVTDDDCQLPVHKIMLAASSDFFKSIFIKSDNQSPFIYLSGIHSNDLNCIVKFIYEGELQISKDKLINFLIAAKKLKIKGVDFKDFEQYDISSLMMDTENQNDDVEESIKTIEEIIAKDCADTDNDVLKDDKLESETSQEENIELKNNYTAAEISKMSPISKKGSDVPNGNIKDVSNLIIYNGLHWECAFCGKTANSSSNIKLHVEIHVEGLDFSCSFCGAHFRSRFLLYNHRARIHKDKIRAGLGRRNKY